MSKVPSSFPPNIPRVKIREKYFLFFKGPLTAADTPGRVAHRRRFVVKMCQSLYKATLALPHPSVGVSPRIRGGVPGHIPGTRFLPETVYATPCGSTRPRPASLRAVLAARLAARKLRFAASTNRTRRFSRKPLASSVSPSLKKSPRQHKTDLNDYKKSVPFTPNPLKYAPMRAKPTKPWVGKPRTCQYDDVPTTPLGSVVSAPPVVRSVYKQPSADCFFFSFPDDVEVNVRGIPKVRDAWTLDLKVRSFGHLLSTVKQIVQSHKPGYSSLYTCFSSRCGRVFTRVSDSGKLVFLCDAFNSNCVFSVKAPAFLAHYNFCRKSGPLIPLTAFFRDTVATDGYCYLRHMFECALRLGAPFFLKRCLLGPFPAFSVVRQRLVEIYGESEVFDWIRGSMGKRTFHCAFSGKICRLKPATPVGGFDSDVLPLTLVSERDGSDFDVPSRGFINPRLLFAAFNDVPSFPRKRSVRRAYLSEGNLTKSLDYIVRYLRRYEVGESFIKDQFIDGPYLINLHVMGKGTVRFEVKLYKKIFAWGDLCAPRYTEHWRSVFGNASCVVFEREFANGFCYLTHIFHMSVMTGCRFDELHAKRRLGRFPTFSRLKFYLAKFFGNNSLGTHIIGWFTGKNTFHAHLKKGKLYDVRRMPAHVRIGGEIDIRQSLQLISYREGSHELPAYGFVNPRLRFVPFEEAPVLENPKKILIMRLQERSLVHALDYVVRYVTRYEPTKCFLRTRFLFSVFTIDLFAPVSEEVKIIVKKGKDVYAWGDMMGENYAKHWRCVLNNESYEVEERNFRDGFCYLKHVYHLCAVEGLKFDEKHATQRLRRYPSVAQFRRYVSIFFGKDLLAEYIKGYFVRENVFHADLIDGNLYDLRFMKSRVRIGGDLVVNDASKMKVVNLAFDKVMETKDSIFVKSVEKSMIDFHQDFEELQKSRPKTQVTVALNESQQVALSKAYPEFQISFTHSSLSAHPVAAASRSLENELLHRWARRDYTDIGGDLKNHVVRGHTHVHVCRPVVDPKDAQRREQRLQEYAFCTPTGVDDAKVFEAVKTLTACAQLAHKCDVQSKTLVSVQVYDMNLQSLCEAMILKKAKISYLTMVTPGELIDKRENFYLPLLECEVSVDAANDVVNYAFGSSVYSHRLSAVVEYMKRPFVVIGHNLFTIEMFSIRCDVNYYKITRSEYCPQLSGVKILRYKRADSGITRIRLPVFDAKLKTCSHRCNYIYLETKFVSQVYEYIVNTCTQINSKTFEWAWNYVKCSKSRVVISGKVIHRDVTIPLEHMEAFVAVMLAAGVKARMSAEYFSKKLAVISGDATYAQMIKYAVTEKLKSTLSSLNHKITEYLKAILSDAFDVQFLTQERAFEDVTEYAEVQVAYDLKPFGSVPDNEELNVLVENIEQRLETRKLATVEKRERAKEIREWEEDKKNSSKAIEEKLPLLGSTNVKNNASNAYVPPHRSGTLLGGASSLSARSLLDMFSGYVRKAIEVVYDFCGESMSKLMSKENFFRLGVNLAKIVGSVVSLDLLVNLAKVVLSTTREDVLFLVNQVMKAIAALKLKGKRLASEMDRVYLLLADKVHQTLESAKEKYIVLKTKLFQNFRHGEWREIFCETSMIALSLGFFDYIKYLRGEFSLIHFNIRWLSKMITFSVVGYQHSSLAGACESNLEWHFREMVAYVTANLVIPTGYGNVERLIVMSCAIPSIVRVLLCSFMDEEDGTYVGYVNHALSVNPIYSHLAYKARHFGLSIKEYIRRCVSDVSSRVGESLLNSVSDASGITAVSNAMVDFKTKAKEFLPKMLISKLPFFSEARNFGKNDKAADEEIFYDASDVPGLKGGNRRLLLTTARRWCLALNSLLKGVKTKVNMWKVENEKRSLYNEVMRELNYIVDEGKTSSFALTKFMNIFQNDERIVDAVRARIGSGYNEEEIRGYVDCAAVVMFVRLRRLHSSSIYSKIVEFFAALGSNVRRNFESVSQMVIEKYHKFAELASQKRVRSNAELEHEKPLLCEEREGTSAVEPMDIVDVYDDYFRTYSIDLTTFENVEIRGGLCGGGKLVTLRSAFDAFLRCVSSIRANFRDCVERRHRLSERARRVLREMMKKLGEVVSATGTFTRVNLAKVCCKILALCRGNDEFADRPGLRGGSNTCISILRIFLRNFPFKLAFQCGLVAAEILFPACFGPRLVCSLMLARKAICAVRILRVIEPRFTDLLIYSLRSEHVPESFKEKIEKCLFMSSKYYHIYVNLQEIVSKLRKRASFLQSKPILTCRPVDETHVSRKELAVDVVEALENMERKKMEFLRLRAKLVEDQRSETNKSAFVNELKDYETPEREECEKPNPYTDKMKAVSVEEEANENSAVETKENLRWADLDDSYEDDENERADLVPEIYTNFKDMRRPQLASSSGKPMMDSNKGRMIGMSKFLIQLNLCQDVPMQPPIEYEKKERFFTNSMRDFYYTQRVALFELFTNYHEKYMELVACGFNPTLTSFSHDCDYAVWDNRTKCEYTRNSKVNKLTTTHIWKNNEYVFTKDGFVFSEEAEKYDICIYGEATSFLSANAFLFKQPNAAVTFENASVKLLVYEAPPGGGKTHTLLDIFIEKSLKHHILVLTANKNSSSEIRKKVVSRCEEKKKDAKGQVPNATVLSRRVMTVDSYLINKYAQKCEVLFIDECFMVHAGAILTCLSATKCRAAVFFGDSKQIHYIHRNDYGNSTANQHDIDLFLHPDCRLPGTVSYRCPNDVCLWLAKEYKHDVVSKNKFVEPDVKTMSIVEIDCSEDVPLEEDVKYLTFTQSEKRELQNVLDKKSKITKSAPVVVNTVHEVQGDTFKQVRLVRTKYQEEGPFSSKNHIIVALSRHTHGLKYMVLRGRLYDDTASCVRLAQTLCAEYKNNFYGESSDMSWDMESYPEGNKGAKAVSSPYQSINSFLETVVGGSTQIELGDMSLEMSSQPFESSVDGVTIQEGNTGRRSATHGVQRV
ncbi:polyprotein 1a [Fig virus A]|uniref:Replicase n=1 Tax=Fig closterovirus 2 TaxID=2809011 RepID=A0A8A0XXG5_9CLOS|nr:polyprotein 1a [Fig virus A]QSQ86333.1 replicase [Fig closterovirus 2]